MFGLVALPLQLYNSSKHVMDYGDLLLDLSSRRNMAFSPKKEYRMVYWILQVRNFQIQQRQICGLIGWAMEDVSLKVDERAEDAGDAITMVVFALLILFIIVKGGAWYLDNDNDSQSNTWSLEQGESASLKFECNDSSCDAVISFSTTNEGGNISSYIVKSSEKESFEKCNSFESIYTTDGIASNEWTGDLLEGTYYLILDNGSCDSSEDNKTVYGEYSAKTTGVNF